MNETHDQVNPVRIPSATYRVQFNLNFRFADAEALIPYLHDLGISHLYASPRFKARRGSSHGYDVADPLRINSELGTEEEFDRLVERLHQYGMSLLLDIVPNHMAASSENPWWMDVLENGRASRYAGFFDIDWEPEGIKISAVEKDRVILPVLAAPYSEILLNQGIRLRFDDRGFFFQYEDNRFPVNPSTYAQILEFCIENLQNEREPSQASVEFLQKLQHISREVPEPRNGETLRNERDRMVHELKSELWNLYQADPLIRQSIDSTLHQLNGAPSEPSSFRRLDELLGSQPYRLAHWRLASTEINYRRFFDINDLVGLRSEDPIVFASRHAAIMRLIQEDKVSGLRVDHIDGLLDPLEYLERLKSIPTSNNHANPGAPSIYTVVEKITSGDELLPREWPCAGTTGYGFLNALNILFVNPQGYQLIEESYARFAGIQKNFADTWYQCKKQVIDQLFATDVDLLSRRLGLLAAADVYGKDVPVPELIAGVKEITACLPVYRTYYRTNILSDRDKPFLEQAFAEARRRAPSLGCAAFHFLRRVFLAELPLESEETRATWLRFILRWQQFTGAVMAKGLEDTALFANHPLISVNEVGNNPFHNQLRFGIISFHEFNSATLANCPHSMTSTATHDTKWSEDLRARVNVLSEMPHEWAKSLRRWSRLNKTRKTWLNGRFAPTPNEEVIFYQAMLGVWPLAPVNQHDRKCLASRLETFFLKAAREAKTETDWLHPNEPHETALRHFVSAIFSASSEDLFISDFLRLHRLIALLGACNSWSQTILKMTAPGVPDFYQGSEMWNFSLADPDNRRPVDFRSRQLALEDIKASSVHLEDSWLTDLMHSWQDGRLKLFLTMRLLNFRRAHPFLFAAGEYRPVPVQGAHHNSVFAFLRHYGSQWLLVVVPRLLGPLSNMFGFPVAKEIWQNTVLELPADAPRCWASIFTNDRLNFSEDALHTPVSDVFSVFPFAVLRGNGSSDAPSEKHGENNH